MEAGFSESPQVDGLQRSETEVTQDGRVKDVNSPQDLNLDPESSQLDQEQQSLEEDFDQVQVQDEWDVTERRKGPPDPPQDQLETQRLVQNPKGDYERGGASGEESDLCCIYFAEFS